MDYRALLKKYMDVVQAAEGTYCLHPWTNAYTAEELAELQAIADELAAEDARLWPVRR